MSKESNIEVKIYTIRDLKDWIYRGADNGLSTSLISNARALAITQNPYAEDSYPAIAVAYEGFNPVGYTAALADKWKGKSIFFGTTGFIDASMRGKGVGTRLYSAMMQACNNQWFASDSAPAALTISKKTGLGIYYFDRYYLSFEYPQNIKAWIKEWLDRNANKKALSNLNPSTRLEVTRYIDDKTYAFIAQHAEHDIFHRSHEMLNWILQSPFKASAPADVASYSDYEFTAALPQYTIYAFRILKEDKLIGFAMFRLNMGDLTLLYLYKDDVYLDDVYATLIKHILSQRITRFRTFDKGLIGCYNQVGAKSMNSKSRTLQISLSVPADVKIDPSQILQGGDGDMFC